MKRKNRHEHTLPGNSLKVGERSKLSTLKQEMVRSIYKERGNLNTLKSRFPQIEGDLTVESLVYMLEAGSLIIMVNGEYTTTVKGRQLLKESQ
ncbi:MAG TPA: hypothetical protein VN040_11540 [Pseudosphingobacterium sp.]|nr:hypothetical protein [Pseudosphingobacterium sp.]